MQQFHFFQTRNTSPLIRTNGFIKSALLLLMVGFSVAIQAQIHGSFQTDVQRYYADPNIGANNVNEKVLSNSFLQLTYQKDHFSTGMRYEAYLNPLLGFDTRYQGQGIPYRFVNYRDEKLDVTVGNFYEQFGNGLTMRAYQEWALGLDNSIDGFRAAFTPVKGITVKGLIGRQRAFWDKSAGLIRGADAEISLNDVLSNVDPSFDSLSTRVTIGGSVSNRYLADDDVRLPLPENVSAVAGRINVTGNEFSLNAEYAYKINDPFAKNSFTYNPGNALYMNAGWFHNHIAVNLTARRIDNFDFRSGRDAQFQEMTLSFLPACTRQHTWRLPTLYPYATQLNGEIGGQLEVTYTIPKKTPLGGKYGTTITFNTSATYGLDTLHTLDTLGRDTRLYSSKPFITSKSRQYFRDFNIELYRKWTPKIKTTLAYINLIYDKSQIELGGPGRGGDIVNAHVYVGEFTYKASDKSTIRTELQAMLTKQDQGNWYMILAEYTFAPHLSFSVWEEYNVGNPNSSDDKFHSSKSYPNGLVAYSWGSNRLAFGYGKQRAGLLCVGGICRVVPASNGFNLSIMSTF